MDHTTKQKVLAISLRHAFDLGELLDLQLPEIMAIADKECVELRDRLAEKHNAEIRAAEAAQDDGA